MSDQGGTSEAGWQPDPFGRHEYRYWDGAAWSDQVSDGGVVSTDPPVVAPAAAAGPPAAGAAPSPGDGSDGGGRSLPVGLLALIGVLAAAVVAVVLVFFVFGDDDGGGTGDFSGTISEDEPFLVRSVELEAGEVMRAVVVPDDDLDARITIALEPDLVRTPLFASLATGEEDDLDDLVDDEDSEFYDEILSGYDELLSESIDSDLSEDLSGDLSEFDDLQDRLSDELPVLTEAGIPTGTEDLGEEGDREGTTILAPLSGTYSIIVSGRASEGEVEGRIDVDPAADGFDAFDADEALDFAEYFEAFGEHRDFICDEDFWGEDPEDVLADAEVFCDEDTYDELLTDLLSDDSSDDFSSDFSDDFSEPAPEFVSTIEPGQNGAGFVEADGTDVYEIQGTGSDVVIRILGTAASGGLDPIVEVFDSAGVSLGSDDDGGNRDRDSRLDVFLEAGELYEIHVTGFSTSEGTYRIRVT